MSTRKTLPAAVLAFAVIAGGASVAWGQASQRFSDVPSDHEAHAAIVWAAEAGITVGYGDGTFKPDQPLSKRHAVVFMERYYDDVLGAEQSEDFTRGDMMMVLHAVAGLAPSAPPPTTIPVTTTTVAAADGTGSWTPFSGTFQGIDPQPYNGIRVAAEEVWDFSSTYGDAYAYLHIRCSQGYTDVFIGWDGLVFGDTDDVVKMDWRWDSDPIIAALAYEGSNAAATFIHDPTAADFSGRETLRVQTYDWYDGGAEKGALFNVSGYDDAKRQLSNCGDDT